jgi:hypothetical protein
MARESKTAGQDLAEMADRLRELNERIIDAGRKAGGDVLDLYEKSLTSIADLSEGRRQSPPVEWVTAVVNAQADFTRGIAKAFAAAGHEALKVTMDVAKQAGDTGAEVTERAARSGAKAAEEATSAVKETVVKQAETITGPQEAPIADYEKLTAEQINAKLPELPQSALARLEAYEQAHQRRTTVLERVGALRGAEPAPGYDEMTVAEVDKLLSGGDAALAGRVRDYERRHKNRTGVLKAVESQADKTA